MRSLLRRIPVLRAGVSVRNAGMDVPKLLQPIASLSTSSSPSSSSSSTNSDDLIDLVQKDHDLRKIFNVSQEKVEEIWNSVDKHGDFPE